MGWHDVRRSPASALSLGRRTPNSLEQELPRYTASAGLAWTLIGRMRELGWGVTVDTLAPIGGPISYRVDFWFIWDDEHPMFSSNEKEFALAVCQAALAVKGLIAL